MPPPIATLAQLHSLLDAGLMRSSTYRGRLSNHLPMALQALLELGASAPHLQAWRESQAPQLEAQPAGEAPAELGRADSDPAWRAHFGARIAALGAAGALRETLPTLLGGAGAIAFHGLIRTGHAVLAGHEGELAAGLAHWAAHWLPLPVADAAPTLALPDWLQALRALPRPSGASGGLITDRMQAWGDTPGFAAVAAGCSTAPTPCASSPCWPRAPMPPAATSPCCIC
jgi:hypothetical protein